MLGVNLCRLVVAATFLFSGFVKAVDPVGMSYKLNAYFSHWGFFFDDDSIRLLFLSVSLACMEFVLGIYLLLGIRRRFTTASVVLFMAAMTLLTLYVYLYDPVPDCGCFGEAVVLGNGQTLVKNLILLVAAVVLFWRKWYIRRLISERNQWITSVFSWVYVIGLSLYSIHYLPVLDFTSYKTGTDLRRALTDPDSPVDLQTFVLFSADEAMEERHEAILSDTGYTFMLTLPDIALADDGCCDRINDIYDDCKDMGISMYGVTSGNPSMINQWKDRTGAAYPFLVGEDTQLKAMVRSNSGLFLLKDGVVWAKWSNNDLPSLAGQSDWQEEGDGQAEALLKLILWFFFPLSVVIFADRIWIGSKYYRHYIFKKQLKKESHEKENCGR